MKPEDKLREQGKALRSASLALAIPTILATGPLVGAGLGIAVDRYIVGHGRAGLLIGLVMGAIAGVRQMLRWVAQMSREAEQDSRKEPPNR